MGGGRRRRRRGRRKTHCALGLAGAAVVLAVCVRATLPSQWETVCSTYYGDKREGSCPVPARQDAALAVEGGRYVHVFGGSGGVVPRSDLWTYDSAARAWALGHADWREESADWDAPVCTADPAHAPTAPVPRTGAVVAPGAGGLLFVGGGVCRQRDTAAGGRGWDTPAAPVADYWAYARATQQWARAWPASRTLPNTTRFASAVHARRLYVFGGVDEATDPEHPVYSNTLWEIDGTSSGNSNNGIRGPSSGPGAYAIVEPAVGSPVPPARADHTAVVAGGRMYVFGGRNETGVLGDLWAYSFAERTWAVVDAGGAAPLPRYAHAAAVCAAAAPDMSDVVVVYGGSSGLALLGTDVHAYSVGQRTWLALAPNGDAPSRRAHASLACGANGELWLFGGVDESGRVLNDFYRMY